MAKPTIFFSHSSIDKNILVKLKDIFLSKTGETVDVFLSSDGQSIPFGRNWVYRIQEQMESAKLMFVFISPSSIKSSWIYFESGYAYSKNIRVIPVGILGVDLANITPPLSLLQGFNILNEDGLDNLTAIVNDEMDFNFTYRFSKEDYAGIFNNANANFTLFEEYTNVINEIDLDYKNKAALKENIVVYNEFDKILKDNKIEYNKNDKAISTYGLTLYSADNDFVIKIDPTSAAITLPLVFALLKIICQNGLKDKMFIFYFVHGLYLVSGRHKVSARFVGSEIKLGNDDNYIYKNIEFSLGESMRGNFRTGIESGPPFMRAKLLNDDIKIEDIGYLIKELFKREILFFG